jgi:hypothetical protein
MALRKLVPLIALSAVVALAMLPASAPAASPSGTVSFGGEGKIQSNGTLNVTLKFDCLPPSPGTIEVTIDEGGMGFGTGEATMLPCDDRNHTVIVNVPGGPWVPGTVTANANLFNADGQVVVSASQEVQIKNQ